MRSYVAVYPYANSTCNELNYGGQNCRWTLCPCKMSAGSAVEKFVIYIWWQNDLSFACMVVIRENVLFFAEYWD